MGTQAGREAVNASHPVLRKLVGYINEEQDKYYTKKEHSDLFKYKCIWLPTKVFKEIDTRYYSKKHNDVKTKTVTFFVNNTYLVVHFKNITNRDSDIIKIEEELKKYKEMEKKLDNL